MLNKPSRQPSEQCDRSAQQTPGRVANNKGTSLTYSNKVIDCVVNPITVDIMKLRPAWSNSFWTQMIGRKPGLVAGVTYKQMLAVLDAAGIERAFLIATKVGRLGLPGSWHLPCKLVADVVQKHPERFYCLAGIDPTARWAQHRVREAARGVERCDHIGQDGQQQEQQHDQEADREGRAVPCDAERIALPAAARRVIGSRRAERGGVHAIAPLRGSTTRKISTENRPSVST